MKLILVNIIMRWLRGVADTSPFYWGLYMNRNSITMFALLFCFAATALAQEKLSPEEIFAWFPSGTYTGLKHADLEKARAGKGWEVSQKIQVAFSGIFSYNTLNWLPPSFREFCNSYTMAEPLRVKIDKSAFKDYEEGSQQRPFLARRAQLCVYRFDSLTDLVAGALKTGEISDTGVSYGGLEIFSHEGINYTGERKEMFAAAFGLEWLVAEDPGSLKLMIATGLQSHPSIMDEDVMADLLEIIPDLGEAWTIGLPGPYSELQQEYYRRQGCLEEYLEKWREEDLQQPIYYFSTMFFADGYTEREIHWYVDEERAAGGKSRTFSQRPSKDDEEKEYKELLIKRQITEVVDNLCIITTVFDEELVEASVKYGLAQVEYWKKKEQEQKK
jgi:hypothetical protein